MASSLFAYCAQILIFHFSIIWLKITPSRGWKKNKRQNLIFSTKITTRPYKKNIDEKIVWGNNEFWTLTGLISPNGKISLLLREITPLGDDSIGTHRY